MGEWSAFRQVCERHNLTIQQLMHSIIVDALIDEGFDALRCQQSERRKSSPTAGETSGSAATGDNYWDYVSRSGPKVDV
jgi:hypothetical protein